MNYRKGIAKYAQLEDIFYHCEHITFDDNSTDSKKMYVKQKDRSDHSLAYTYVEMLKVVKVFCQVLYEKILKQAAVVKTPIGNLEIRRYKTKSKKSFIGGKTYKQTNVMNWAFELISTEKKRKYKNSHVMKLQFSKSGLNKLYKDVEKDTSVIYHLEEWN